MIRDALGREFNFPTRRRDGLSSLVRHSPRPSSRWAREGAVAGITDLHLPRKTSIGRG